jgi:hypothetical protein
LDGNLEVHIIGNHSHIANGVEFPFINADVDLTGMFKKLTVGHGYQARFVVYDNERVVLHIGGSGDSSSGLSGGAVAGIVIVSLHPFAHSHSMHTDSNIILSIQ